EYVPTSCQASPPPGSSQSVLPAGWPDTTGTGVPGWNDSVVPAPTCSGPRCGDHVVVPSVGSPSISPLASNSIGASTFKVTGCCMRTVVGSLNTGGEGDVIPRGAPSGPALTNTASSTRVGAMMANIFSQYWNARVTVMARMPPPSTVISTSTVNATGPAHSGPPNSVRAASSAPCSCGIR